MKRTEILFVFFLTLSLTGVTQPVFSASLSAADQDIVSDHFRKQDFQGVGDLHLSNNKFADGAKGIRIEIGDEYPAVSGSGKFKNVEEEIFFSQICSADVIALATDLGSEPILSKQKDTIFTVSRFQPSEIVKQTKSLSTVEPFLVAQVGGDLVDENERLRMEIINSQQLNLGDTYLLFLRKEAKASKPVFYLQRAVKVTNGRVYPDRKWLDVSSGMPYSGLKEKIAFVQEIEQCRR